MVKRMKITSIQVCEDTRKKLEGKKLYARESYNDVIERIMEDEDTPSMEEMFKRAEKMKMEKYSTKDVVRIIRELREG
jgi:predicted CopG family antitoxin